MMAIILVALDSSGKYWSFRYNTDLFFKSFKEYEMNYEECAKGGCCREGTKRAEVYFLKSYLNCFEIIASLGGCSRRWCH